MSKHNPNFENGALTNSMNTDSKEFRELQLLLLEAADSLSEDQKINIELVALKIKIEDYLAAQLNKEELITVGQFLSLFLKKLNIRQNKLASYIGINPSNFNKIITGERKINFELSNILGHLFGLDPLIWMQIQVKNDYLSLSKSKRSFYKKFKLKDLMKS